MISQSIFKLLKLSNTNQVWTTESGGGPIFREADRFYVHFHFN